MFQQLFFTFFLIVPFCAICLWTFLTPKDSIWWAAPYLFEDPEYSESYVKYIKFMSMTLLIGWPLIIIGFMFDVTTLKFALPIVGFLVIYAFVFILTGDK